MLSEGHGFRQDCGGGREGKGAEEEEGGREGKGAEEEEGVRPKCPTCDSFLPDTEGHTEEVSTQYRAGWSCPATWAGNIARQPFSIVCPREILRFYFTVPSDYQHLIGKSVRFNWPHITGESQQFIYTVGNPPSQCRSLGTYTLLRVKCGSLGTYTLTAD